MFVKSGTAPSIWKHFDTKVFWLCLWVELLKLGLNNNKESKEYYDPDFPPNFELLHPHFQVRKLVQDATGNDFENKINNKILLCILNVLIMVAYYIFFFIPLLLVLFHCSPTMVVELHFVDSIRQNLHEDFLILFSLEM